MLLEENKNIQNTLSYTQVTKDFQNKAAKLNSITLTDRQVCDLELILNGAFNPLTGFMNKKDYNAVLNTMRLDNGKLWPIPITLDIDQDTIDLYKLKKGIKVSLVPTIKILFRFCANPKSKQFNTSQFNI